MKTHGEQGLLGNGVQLLKTDPLVEAVGTVEELNAALGFALIQYKLNRRLMDRIQADLCGVGAELSFKSPFKSINDSIEHLDKQINFFKADLPEPPETLIPGGNPACAWLYFCRTICQRAERRVGAVIELQQITNVTLVTFLNRLAVLLLMLARFENAGVNEKEMGWNPIEK